MARIFLYHFFQFILINCGVAQYYFYNERYYSSDIVWELGPGAGIMNSLTDIGGNNSKGINALKDFNWSNSQIYYSACLRANFKEVIAGRIDLGFGSVKAADSLLSENDPLSRDRFLRNLGFRSSIAEAQFVFEIYPLNFFSAFPSRALPYFIFGVGLFHFNPKASLEGKWYNLRPLRLEGQGFEEYPDRKLYKLSQVHIPIGGGIRFNLRDCLHLQLEWQHHLLFTDYLDDVSTSYINPLLFHKYLPPEQAALADRLYNRMAERQPGVVTIQGNDRGNQQDRDAYFSIQMRIGWSFRARYRH